MENEEEKRIGTERKMHRRGGGRGVRKGRAAAAGGG